jgi:hypothetical protein
MKTSSHILGSLGTGLFLLVAGILPQHLLAQRFAHGGGGGGGYHPAPASRPAPVMVNRPAPVVNRPAPVVNRPAPVVNNRPTGAINGGSVNNGNHDFGRAGTVVDSRASVNTHINVHENVNVYHGSGRITYRPYAYHPYHPYRWGPSWHPLGYFWAGALAADAFYFNLANQAYYYDDGVYYEPYNGGYNVVAAPVGAIVASLPPGYETVQVGDDTFLYYGGTFYVQTDQGYQVVVAPDGAVVSEIPDGATQQDVNGQTYLIYNNTYFLPVSSDGQDAYQVVVMNQ